MHSSKLIALFFIIAYIAQTEALLILAGILAVKAAIVGAFIIGGIAGGIVGSAARRGHGGRGRYGRSVQDVDQMFLVASQNDADDCAKKLICSLSARNPTTLAEDEAAIVSLFGQTDSLDVSKPTIEFDLAATMGRKVGEKHCNVVYARCNYTTRTLMEVMRSPDLNRV